MRRLLLFVLLAALGAAACSSSEGDAPPSPAPSATVDAQAAGDPPSAEAVAFCTEYDAVLGSGALSDTFGTAETPEEASTALRDAIDTIQSVTRTAPEGVRADLTLVNDANARTVLALADLLEGEHGDVLWPYFQSNESPATIPDDASDEELAARDAAEEWSQDAQEAFADDVIAASERVGGWYRTNCLAG